MHTYQHTDNYLTKYSSLAFYPVVHFSRIIARDWCKHDRVDNRVWIPLALLFHKGLNYLITATCLLALTMHGCVCMHARETCTAAYGGCNNYWQNVL